MASLCDGDFDHIRSNTKDDAANLAIVKKYTLSNPGVTKDLRQRAGDLRRSKNRSIRTALRRSALLRAGYDKKRISGTHHKRFLHRRQIPHFSLFDCSVSMAQPNRGARLHICGTQRLGPPARSYFFDDG